MMFPFDALRSLTPDQARTLSRGGRALNWWGRLVALFSPGDLFLSTKHLFVAEARNGAGCSNHAARATDDRLR